MIAALAVAAASILAPSGVAAANQGDPVCLPATAQPGHTYGFTITASSGNLTVVPDRLDAAPLEQVPPSWVTFGSSSGTLTIPQDAAAGPYQSLIEVTAPGGAGQVSLGTAATTALVFTVGPSRFPPPPCAALDLAQSTGKFPPWPTEAFATTGWHQVFASQEASERAAHTAPTAIPTAGTGAPAPAVAAPAAPAPAYSPVANAGPAGNVPKVPSNWPGYLALAVIALLVLAGLRRWMRS